jgi:hypothetical protein
MAGELQMFSKVVFTLIPTRGVEAAVYSSWDRGSCLRKSVHEEFYAAIPFPFWVPAAETERAF